jgi:predicted metal-binding protein
VEPVARFVRQLLSSSGRLLVADPSERTRYNRWVASHLATCMLHLTPWCAYQSWTHPCVALFYGDIMQGVLCGHAAER